MYMKAFMLFLLLSWRVDILYAKLYWNNDWLQIT